MRTKKQNRLTKCKVRGCNRTDITGFGNCDSHYQKHARLVALGRDTWEAIVERGDAIPSKTMLIRQAQQSRS
jgi:hypothetical protein